MAIYRPPKARWPLAVATLIAGLLIGGLAGWALGSKDPDPNEVAGDIRTKLTQAATVLDVVPIEYDEGVEDGEVVSDAEYSAAGDAVDRSRTHYDEVAPALESLAPETADEIESAYETLDSAIEEVADPDEVTSAAEALADLLNPS